MRVQFGRHSVLALCFILTAQSAFAAEPRFTNLMPRGGQRGHEVDVVLSGDNLEDAEELLLYDEGLEVVKFEQPESEKAQGRQLKVTLKLPKDCELGTHRMRVRTRTGLSDLQNFYVTPYPVVDEKEPNTDFATPQAIEKNVAVFGRIDREDVDYYVVEAKQGERIAVEIFGMRLGFSTGRDFFDPYVAIMDEERFELGVSDDTPLVWNDSVASIIAPKDGRYVVQVRDSSYNGDGRAFYFANIGNFPRPHAVLPTGGKPGETLTVTFLGDISGPITREVTLPDDPNIERFGLEVQDEYGMAPTTQPFRLSPLQNHIEQEPNNDRKSATPASAPAACNGVISEAGDVDYFEFSAKKNQQFEIEVYARRIRSALDPVMYVYRQDNGGRVVSDDDTRGPDSYERFKAPEDGKYVVSVRDHLKNGGEAYTYRIEISPVEPEITTQPIEFSRYVQQQIIIPQGAGSGIVANVRRENVGGPVNYRGEDLPAGVRIECPEGWRTSGSMPVVFYADEDAPVAGKFAEVTTFIDDEKQKDPEVTGVLSQDVLMVRGRNNNRVWEERQTRLPIVVTEKAPFKVWIEEPKAPMVRGGSMQLVVKCEREEGWDEEIRVLLLQNPPGVNSSRSVKIKKGKTQAEIPMNASDKASVQTTMISLRCIAKVDNGDVELCTPFVPVTVEDQYMTLEFTQAAVEKGKEIAFPVNVKPRKEFEGEAEVQLLGLPANTEVEKLTLTAKTEELNFIIKATDKTPAGMSKNIFCRVLVPENGTTVLHNLGTGRLRVDNPPPAPKEESKPKPSEVAKQDPPKKPLSRLEMLRLQKKQAAASGSE